MASTHDWLGGAMSGLLSGGAGGSLQNAQFGVSYQAQAQMQNAMAQQWNSDKIRNNPYLLVNATVDTRFMSSPEDQKALNDRARVAQFVQGILIDTGIVSRNCYDPDANRFVFAIRSYADKFARLFTDNDLATAIVDNIAPGWKD